MTWVNERVTSLLYGAAGGVAVPMVVDLPPPTVLGTFCTLAVASELYRGWMRRGDA